MAVGTGLDASVGFGAESTVGTAVTPTNWYEFDSESIHYDPTFLEPTGLRPSRYVKRGSRSRISRKGVTGSVSMQHATKGMSLLWKHLLGSSVAAADTGTQAHTFGGTYVGQSLTVQVGRPLPSGTVQAFTYNGCKPTGWEFSCSDNEIATLSVDLDGWNQTTATALTAPTYLASNSVYAFSDVTTFTLGGSAVATAVVCRGITIRGEMPWANERYGLGNAGVKNEQLLNGTPVLSGTISAEFNKTLLFDAFVAETLQAMVLTFTKGTSTLTFNAPSMKLKGSAPQVDGPDVVSMDVDFEIYDDETNPPLTVTIVN